MASIVPVSTKSPILEMELCRLWIGNAWYWRCGQYNMN